MVTPLQSRMLLPNLKSPENVQDNNYCAVHSQRCIGNIILIQLCLMLSDVIIVTKFSFCSPTLAGFFVTNLSYKIFKVACRFALIARCV